MTDIEYSLDGGYTWEIARDNTIPVSASCGVLIRGIGLASASTQPQDAEPATPVGFITEGSLAALREMPPNFDTWKNVMIRNTDHGNCKVALYVSPAPAVQAVGEPSDEEIFAKALEHGYGYFTGGSGRPFRKGDAYGEKMLAFVRDLLAATIQPPPSAEPAPADPRPVVGIVDERYLRPTIGGEG